LESVDVRPKELQEELEHRLTDNVDLVCRSGGIFPDNPSEFWECVIRVLEHVKKDYDWFDYEAPEPPERTSLDPGVKM
jgi:hypothetical protein